MYVTDNAVFEATLFTLNQVPGGFLSMEGEPDFTDMFMATSLP